MISSTKFNKFRSFELCPTTFGVSRALQRRIARASHLSSGHADEVVGAEVLVGDDVEEHVLDLAEVVAPSEEGDGRAAVHRRRQLHGRLTTRTADSQRHSSISHGHHKHHSIHAAAVFLPKGLLSTT